jgi:hypothetical protein
VWYVHPHLRALIPEAERRQCQNGAKRRSQFLWSLFQGRFTRVVAANWTATLLSLLAMTFKPMRHCEPARSGRGNPEIFEPAACLFWIATSLRSSR